MEEKKLTDEEIVKALECCAMISVNPNTRGECTECPYFQKAIDCFSGKRSEMDTLDLIHRLQDENEWLKDEKEEIRLFNLALQNGEVDMRIESEMAKSFYNSIVQVFEQNGAKNFFTTTIDIEGKNGRYAFTIEKMGGQTVAEKLAEQKAEIERLKEQLKSVQSSCQSKNAKIKNLTAENEALQNELNFQNGKPHYRYVVWNTKQNKRQFPSICELTESGAYTKLFQKIGWDSAKYRFEVRRIKVDGVEVE